MAGANRSSGLKALFGLAIGGATSTASLGQEYCIVCSAPDAIYRCVIEQGKPTGTPLKHLCVGILAREGKHASCSVTGGTVFDCKGPIRRVEASAATKLLATPEGSPPQTAVQGPSSKPNEQAPAKKIVAEDPKEGNRPPQTVEQLAKDMSRSSGETLGKAGAAIGGTTRKAWNCLASLFKSC